MLHGKKGFERIVWAFKNVLNHSLTWLFHDLQASNHTPPDVAQAPEPQKTPLDAHHPFHHTVNPATTTLEGVKVPPLTQPPEDNDSALELHEWLGLVALRSPRVQATDSIDPFLCRYQVPNVENAATYDLVCIRWKGFIPSIWIRSLFIELR